MICHNYKTFIIVLEIILILAVPDHISSHMLTTEIFYVIFFSSKTDLFE